MKRFLISVELNTIPPGENRMKTKMKRVMIQLIVVGAVVAGYALPILAAGGAGP
jgi:hypothetical protein